MAKFRVYAAVWGACFLGEIEADDRQAAQRKADMRLVGRPVEDGILIEEPKVAAVVVVEKDPARVH